MTEQLELHIPHYLTEKGRTGNPNPHEIIHLQVPRIPHLRAAYYHDILTNLWHNGHGTFTHDDIFTLYPFQAIHRDIYLDVQTYNQKQNGLVDGGNIQTRHILGNSVAAKATRRAITAIEYEQVYADIETYLQLPRDEAIKRTKPYSIHWADEPTQISEAEYWLRHNAVHTGFNDEHEALVESLNEYKQQQPTQKLRG